MDSLSTHAEEACSHAHTHKKHAGARRPGAPPAAEDAEAEAPDVNPEAGADESRVCAAVMGAACHAVCRESEA